MSRPMIALAVALLIAAPPGCQTYQPPGEDLWLAVPGVGKAEAKQVVEKPVISEKRASILQARCVGSAIARRIAWVVRAADGNVKSFGFVIVRKCSW